MHGGHAGGAGVGGGGGGGPRAGVRGSTGVRGTMTRSGRISKPRSVMNVDSSSGGDYGRHNQGDYGAMGMGKQGAGAATPRPTRAPILI